MTPEKTSPEIISEDAAFKNKLTEVLDDVFLKHPRTAGEHYLQHLWYTVKVAGYLIVSACCAVLHGLFPKILQTTTSDRIIALANNMLERRKKCDPAAHKHLTG